MDRPLRNDHIVDLCRFGMKSLEQFVLIGNKKGYRIQQQDINIVRQHANAWRGMVDMIMKVAPQYNPYTDPEVYAFDTGKHDAAIDSIENDHYNKICRLYRRAVVELRQSQSAQEPGGIESYDVEIFNGIMAELEEFLKYAEGFLPLAMPEATGPAA